ncbi:hypothetical protein BH23BAC3_BH23BAC3_00820 [soil metagenome]
MARSIAVILLLIIVSSLSFNRAEAQIGGDNYELIPAPDLWYNDVDGIRVGVRFKGQVPGTFEDGPHRLDAGLWLGLWIPDLPVSYYLSYTNPISAWSDFGSEASYQAISSVRTGYTVQGIGFNKRWQQGFDERRYRELRLFNSYEKRFDKEYTAFSLLWSDQDKLLTTLMAELQDDNTLGWYNLAVSGGFQYNDDSYGFATITAIQRVPFNQSWGVRFRGFLGLASTSTAPEYLFSRSTGQAIRTLRNGVTRAKGTVPQPWMESGKFQFAGGANLRGYTSADVESFVYEPCVNCNADDFILNQPMLFRTIAAFNTEFDYPNPVRQLFDRVPYVSEFLNFRSYLFFDAGSSLGLGEESTNLFADAGAGFSLSMNIPDYQGKDRGFVLRYDIPFWLSEPGTDDAFKYRSLFAFGAVISF